MKYSQLGPNAHVTWMGKVVAGKGNKRAQPRKANGEYVEIIRELTK